LGFNDFVGKSVSAVTGNYLFLLLLVSAFYEDLVCCKCSQTTNTHMQTVSLQILPAVIRDVVCNSRELQGHSR